MNGFAGAILSVLLGWIRALLDNLWRVLNSESGGTFLSFLRLHWKTIFIVICAGGFVLDRIIYFFRWRPDYVWSTKLGRLKRKLNNQADPEEDGLVYSSREATAYPAESYAPQPYTPESYAPSTTDLPLSTITQHYAPANPSQPFAPLAQQSPSYSYASPPLEDVPPVFDDPTESWAPLSASFAPMTSYQQPYEHPAQDMEPAFGTVKPEPEVYLRDVQAGFAPAPTPQQLYPPAAAPVNSAQPVPTTPPPGEPVHPGLDLETFQQNIGISEPRETVPEEESSLRPLVDFPNTTFVSYYKDAEPGQTTRSRSALSSFAKKARELVRTGNEDNPPTIKDLQSVVSMKNAFHPPVMPKKNPEGGEE